MAEYQVTSGTVSTNGDNVIYVPPTGKQPQIFYFAFSAAGTNLAPVTVSMRFASGTPLYTVSLVPGAIYSRNIGAGKFCVHGSPDDTVILNLSSNSTVNWNLEYWNL